MISALREEYSKTVLYVMGFQFLAMNTVKQRYQLRNILWDQNRELAQESQQTIDIFPLQKAYKLKEIIITKS